MSGPKTNEATGAGDLTKVRSPNIRLVSDVKATSNSIAYKTWSQLFYPAGGNPMNIRPDVGTPAWHALEFMYVKGTVYQETWREAGMPNDLASAIHTLRYLGWPIVSSYYPTCDDDKGLGPLRPGGFEYFALSSTVFLRAAKVLRGKEEEARLRKLVEPVDTVSYALYEANRVVMGGEA
jgi:hypothetical protein